MSTTPIPPELRERHERTPAGRKWLSVLPDLIISALARWNLSVDLPAGATPWHGHWAIVVPVRSGDGTALALKISHPLEDAALEPIALDLWGGLGAVELVADDRDTSALLLARLDAGRSLQTVAMDEAVETWGAIMKSLCITPDGRPGWAALPHVADVAEQYSDDLPAQWETLGRPFERWLLEAALEVCQTRGIVGRRSGRDVLVHTDLHYMNILGRLDAPGYVAIDPQASIGEAEFAVAPCLWNRILELPRHNPEAALRARCDALCAAAGLDAGVATEWAIVREVENALWYLAKPDHEADAQRSLWVAATMAGSAVRGLPAAHQLKPLV
ncbi:aminoglycoside phosphotransferase family protein [Specibacter cremeus]|uniref:aminoglycoside phosphotransferase family protein n=1 Tax=Specibacter cremeus TaxID=1629051 RepID=UPI000F7B22D9|nr:aminoglycoside phosphotransferase family protein [Specibacter cremeus]